MRARQFLRLNRHLHLNLHLRLPVPASVTVIMYKSGPTASASACALTYCYCKSGPKAGGDAGPGKRKIELRDIILFLERDPVLRKSPVLTRVRLTDASAAAGMWLVVITSGGNRAAP